MKKKHFPGKLIAFEGLDGSGKSTQTKLLVERLKKEGYRTVMIDFPQYGQKSAGLIEEYLNGKYGPSEKVGPYRASIFFACDRYDASFKIRNWLKGGKIIVSDRYVGSNIGHQGAKIKNKEERKEFIKWLCALEYDIFEIPKPKICFILKTFPKLSKKMAPKINDSEKKKKRLLYLGRKKRDIHEEDIRHLQNSLDSYLQVAKEFPKDFKIIECTENGKFLPVDLIHQRIWKMVEKIL